MGNMEDYHNFNFVYDWTVVGHVNREVVCQTGGAACPSNSRFVTLKCCFVFTLMMWFNAVLSSCLSLWWNLYFFFHSIFFLFPFYSRLYLSPFTMVRFSCFFTTGLFAVSSSFPSSGLFFFFFLLLLSLLLFFSLLLLLLLSLLLFLLFLFC